MSEAPTIAIHGTGTPNLLPAAPGVPAGDASPNSGVPGDNHDPGAPVILDGPAPEDAREVVQEWTPDQATGYVTGTHNIPGALMFLKRPALYKAWHADKAELDHAGDALARLLGKLGPPGKGLFGMLGDVIRGLGAVLEMEVRHLSAVQELARQQVAEDPITPPTRAPKPQAPPDVSPPSNEGPAGSVYHHPPEVLAAMNAAQQMSEDTSNA